MKLGVSSYSFSQLMRTGKATLLEVIGKAKDMGFEVIEFITFSPPEGETLESFAARIKEECQKVGIEMGNYTIGADFLNNTGGNWEAEVERLKGQVEIARILGAPGIRHDATAGFPAGYPGPKGFDDALPLLIQGCRAVTEYAAEFGIKTMVENHGFFCQDSERVEKLVNGVAHQNFGVLLDMGNFLCADEDPAKAVGRLMPYVFHVHAKDFHVKSGNGPNPGQGWFQSRAGNYLRGSIIGHGDVPITQCINIVKKAGYNNTISIEYEGMEDAEMGIAIGLENLKRYLG
ncbi:MAG: sugar phosphate isomerase/epimerase [Epulopiscium sp.]|mgnify:FL=1|nr:sugar phosphate isomerase/epimerase [Candidatus Epulonipiscium sp.]